MDYLREINAFYEWLETNPIPSPARILWHALMQAANRAGWATEFSAAISMLEAKSGLSRSALYRARNQLKGYGLIDFKNREGMQSSLYRINSIVFQYGTQSGTQSGTQTGTQAEHKPGPLINKTNTLQQKSVGGRFVKPTLDAVQAYCTEHKSSVNPVRFFYYYEANGWRMGKAPMKDWRAALRMWEQTEVATLQITRQKNTTTGQPQLSPAEAEALEDLFETL